MAVMFEVAEDRLTVMVSGSVTVDDLVEVELAIMLAGVGTRVRVELDDTCDVVAARLVTRLVAASGRPVARTDDSLLPLRPTPVRPVSRPSGPAQAVHPMPGQRVPVHPALRGCGPEVMAQPGEAPSVPHQRRPEQRG